MKDKFGERRDRGVHRRGLLALSAAAGASAIASPWTFQSSRAAPRVVKIGMVSPATGAIAAFGEADQFVLAGVRNAIGDDIVIAGEKHPVEIVYKDSQSNPNRAAEVTAQLINNDKVDIIIGSSTSDTVLPVADQCELAGVPCVTSDDPWQVYFFGRKGDPKKPFEWTYHFFWGLDQLGNVFADMWLSLPSNHIVGSLFSNDGDGNDANAHLPDFFKSKGLTPKNLGIYSNNADDFSGQIADLKRGDCEIVTGVFTPPEFGVFWTQSAQQGYKPKMVTPAKALLFPASVEALSSRGVGLSTEVWWSPHHPFKSSLTGQSALQFCDAYTAATGRQWTQPIGFKHANLEVAIDVLKRTKKLDPAALRDSILETNYQSLVGPIAWKGGKTNPVANVCTTPLVGGQWKKGTKFPYDLHVFSTSQRPRFRSIANMSRFHMLDIVPRR